MFCIEIPQIIGLGGARFLGDVVFDVFPCRVN